MLHWAGLDGAETATRYRSMARHVRGFSPSYERLCLGVADDACVVARLDTLPRPKRQPNLLFGAVRFLDGPVDRYASFRAFVLDGWDTVAETMTGRRTQTNEPRRCATLLPVLAALPQPLALVEVGASAGLCLHPDRYAYRYDDRDPLGASDVVLDCATSGPVPIPAALPIVSWRRGVDLHPLDVHDEGDVRWLEALVWPEEADRLATLRSAVAIARQRPVEIVEGDLTTDLGAVCAGAPDAATLVVFHSAVLAYLDADGRDAFRAELAELASTRPVVWVANESPGVVVDPGREPALGDPVVLARDGVALAWTNSHGRSIDWFAA